MPVGYTGIQWNRQKRIYDLSLIGILLLGLSAFVVASLIVRPQITAETLIIRGTAVSAFVLLHVILCIGPLARIDRRFLPLLFNRRHLGVTVFLLAMVHAGISIFQFHAFSDANPLVSVLTAYKRDYAIGAAPGPNLPHFPFEPFGLFALGVLFLMAATSHDFWLRNLGPSLWKALHLLVLAAYGALVLHVAYGALQAERHPLYVVLLGAGVASVVGLHLVSALREAASDRHRAAAERDGLLRACSVDDLEPGRGRAVRLGPGRVAVFLHEGRVWATSNVCRHQGGPLGEGRIIDGCITCPWHGWQYRPQDGCSPPPFEEKVETYAVRVIDGEVWIDPQPGPPGTPREGAAVERG